MTTSPSGAQPPAYPSAPAEYGPATPSRPGMVKAAAILAFIWGGLTIVSSLISMTAGSLLAGAGSACAKNDQSGLCAFAADSGSMLIVIGIALIAAAALMIWGGTVALNGTNAKVLVITSGIQIIIQIFWMINTGSIAFGIVGVIVPIGIIALMMNTASKNWFETKGKATR
ncbi:MAG: hypothetical protein ABI382_01215 [Nakamurella sp.]